MAKKKASAKESDAAKPSAERSGTAAKRASKTTQGNDRSKHPLDPISKPKLKIRANEAGEIGSDPKKADVVLLSGGNPQIAKGDGDAPVQAYIAAMPGWKQALGKRLDALIVRTEPTVRKAVKWNSPFYGMEGQGSFLSFHVFTRYVKVTFFNGMSLRPIPPGGTPKSKDARWIDIHEEDAFDEKLFASWVKQAASLPGWKP